MDTLKHYESQAKSLSAKYEQANVNNIHTLLLKTFPKHSKLLELGCGSGRDASFMFKNSYTITAIDASRQMINEAKLLHSELSNCLHVSLLPDDLNYKENSFDGIYSIATLMHLEATDIELTVKKVSEYLKPDGIFLFSVSVQRDDINTEGKDSFGRHFTTLSQEDWILTCKRMGFNLVHSELSGDGLGRDGIVWFTCVLRK